MQNNLYFFLKIWGFGGAWGKKKRATEMVARFVTPLGA